MESEKEFKEKLRIFEKIKKLGYNTEKKIGEMDGIELIKQTNFTRAELNIAADLIAAVKNKCFVSFLCGVEEQNTNKK